jgi:hypothetical protein
VHISDHHTRDVPIAKAHQEAQGAGWEAVGFDGVTRIARTYLSERFPVAQAGAVLTAYVCCYLLYGQAHSHQVFRWETVVGGMTVVLLALIRRIVDDVEDLLGDIRADRPSFADGGRRRLRGLVFGGAAAIALVGFLNATCSLGLLAASVGIAVWFPVASVMKQTVVARSSRILFFIISESCPVAGLLYPYAVWHEASGATLPAMTVVAITGLFWTIWQFWVFTRKVGAEGWPPWGLTMDGTRNALIAFLALTAVFSVLIYHYANLPIGYLIYGLSLSAIFAAIIFRWWSRLPVREPNRVDGSWGGLPFAVAVEVGVLIAVLASSV